MPASSAWKEADRSDRLRYSQPARLRGQNADSGISGRRANPCQRWPRAALSQGLAAHDGACCAAFAGAATGASPARAGEPTGTHYALLGVQHSASQAQLRRAYLRQLVTVHPDKGGQPEQFQQLQAAFAVLSDPAERRIYDEKLERVHGGGAAMGSTAGSCSCSRAGGARAVVHGQTLGSGQQPPGPAAPPAAAAAAGACPASSSSSAVEEASTEIQALQEAAGASSSSGGDPAARGWLAAAYLRRAGLRREAGQLHHALFDAEEACRLQPDLCEAADVAAALQAVFVMPQEAALAAAAAAGQGEEDQQQAREEELDGEPF